MIPPDFSAVVLLPRLRIQNANAISSPITWGFPAPSAFTGFVHALQLRLNVLGYTLCLGGVGIVCHEFDPQVFAPPGRRTKVFRLTRNPIDKDGTTAAIVEEGRCHLEVSLLITVAGSDCPVNEAECDALAAEMLSITQGMRIAGGSILPHPRPDRYPARWLPWDRSDHEASIKAFRKLRWRLLPGFALVSRENLLAQHLDDMQKQAPNSNALDALLDLCRLNIEPETETDATGNSKVEWKVRRPYRGWLVPLPVGYAAISALYAPGEVRNTRDPNVPFHFVESVISLGEWVSPHRVAGLEQLLWHHHAQEEEGLYRLRNFYSPTPSRFTSN